MSDNYSRISQNIFWSKRSLYIFLDLNPFNTPLYLILHSDTKPTLFLQNSIVRFQMCHVCQKCAFVLSSTAQQEECSNVLQCPKSNYSSQFVKFFTWDKELYRKWKIATSTDFSKQTLFSEKKLFRFMLLYLFLRRGSIWNKKAYWPFDNCNKKAIIKSDLLELQ